MTNNPDNLIQQLQAVEHPALMLDYDGTLTPITTDPDEARLTSPQMSFLAALVEKLAPNVAFVSGRSVSQLDGFLHPLEVYPIIFAGLHGGEINRYPGPNVLRQPDEQLGTMIAEFKQRICKFLATHGYMRFVHIEDKRFTLAVHYRQVAQADQPRIIQEVETIYQAIDGFSDVFRLQRGKAVVEPVPHAFNKGLAVQYIRELWQKDSPGKELGLIYIGDDLTDEAAFEAINQLNGISIFVGDLSERATKARYNLRSVEAVYNTLEQAFQVNAIHPTV